MPTITIPPSPIGANDNVNVSIEYAPDQGNTYAKLRIEISKLSLAYGDQLIFNGQPWTYSANLTTPTDFKSPEDLLVRFNNNPDFNREYESYPISETVALYVAEFVALIPTSESDITANVTGAIGIVSNTAGTNEYSKNDLAQFAQLVRLEGSTTTNEKRTNEPTYNFEISSQVRGRLTPFKIEDGIGVIFQNEGSYNPILTEVGTTFIASGDTIKQSIYTDFVNRSYYLGDQHAGGYISDRLNSKPTNLDLFEYCSFLVSNVSSVTKFKRRIDVIYTDLTTDIIIDGSVNNPINGIVTAQAYFNSFNTQTDNSKTVSKWTVSLCETDGTIVYEGQSYSNRIDNCVSFLQVLFTNVYGGIEVETFKTLPTLSYSVDSQDSRTGSDREFNFITEDTEILAIDEQNITDNQYLVLKGLLKSKWVYINQGNGLTPVRMTASNLTNETFNANFKLDA
jgi:hypothetical protein